MVLFWFLTLLGVAIVASATGGYLAKRRNAREGTVQSLNKFDRAELKALRNLVDRVDNLAYDNREINPELSVQIIDEIRSHNRKIGELER